MDKKVSFIKSLHSDFLLTWESMSVINSEIVPKTLLLIIEVTFWKNQILKTGEKGGGKALLMSH